MVYSITIDGPSGSGKSTLAKNLQKKLKAFTLVDTGAYYRWSARLCLDHDIDVKDKKAVFAFVKDKLDLQFIPYPRGHKYYSAKIFYQGNQINDKLYTREVTENVPIVATYPKLRNLVKLRIRHLAKEHNIIVAGRDIGTDVLPKAEVKIYLNPSAESRARRRYRDEIKQGRSISLSELKENINSRDEQDMNHQHGPLRQPDDALVIDNTYYTPTRTLNDVMKYVLKNIPDAEKLEPPKTEPDKPVYTWSSETTNTTPASESTAELKKRLKEKYKRLSGGASGGAGFFNKY